MHGEAPHVGLVDDAVLHGQVQGAVPLPVEGRMAAGQHAGPLGPRPGNAHSPVPVVQVLGGTAAQQSGAAPLACTSAAGLCTSAGACQ